MRTCNLANTLFEAHLGLLMLIYGLGTSAVIPPSTAMAADHSYGRLGVWWLL